MTPPVTTQSLAECVILADFTPAQRTTWRSVNDNVMGGRSEGSFSFDQEHIVFEGFINTNGGGFASVRKPLPEGALVGRDVVRLRVRSPSPKLPYRLSLSDGSMRSVSFSGYMNLSDSTDWQEVEVSLSNLRASRFGRPMDVPFEPAKMRSMGLILSNDRDAPFKLEVDWIKACTTQEQS